MFTFITILYLLHVLLRLAPTVVFKYAAISLFSFYITHLTGTLQTFKERRSQSRFLPIFKVEVVFNVPLQPFLTWINIFLSINQRYPEVISVTSLLAAWIVSIIFTVSVSPAFLNRSIVPELTSSPHASRTKAMLGLAMLPYGVEDGRDAALM